MIQCFQMSCKLTNQDKHIIKVSETATTRSYDYNSVLYYFNFLMGHLNRFYHIIIITHMQLSYVID